MNNTNVKDYNFNDYNNNNTINLANCVSEDSYYLDNKFAACVNSNNVLSNDNFGVLVNRTASLKKAQEFLTNETQTVFKKVEEKFEVINNATEALNNRTNTLNGTINAVSQDLNSFKTSVNTDFGNVNTKIGNLNTNLTSFKETTNKNFKEVEEEFETINGTIDDIFDLIEKMRNGEDLDLNNVINNAFNNAINNLSDTQIENLTNKILNTQIFKEAITNVQDEKIVEAMNLSCAKAVESITGNNVSTCVITKEDLNKNLLNSTSESEAIMKTLGDAINKDATVNMKSAEQAGASFRKNTTIKIASFAVCACALATGIAGYFLRDLTNGIKSVVRRDKSPRSKKLQERYGLQQIPFLKNAKEDKTSLKIMIRGFDKYKEEEKRRMLKSAEYKILTESIQRSIIVKEERKALLLKKLENYQLSEEDKKETESEINRINIDIKEVSNFRDEIDDFVIKSSREHAKFVFAQFIESGINAESEAERQRRIEENREAIFNRLVRRFNFNILEIGRLNLLDIGQDVEGFNEAMDRAEENLGDAIDNADLIAERQALQQADEENNNDIIEDGLENFDFINARIRRAWERRGANEPEHARPRGNNQNFIGTLVIENNNLQVANAGIEANNDVEVQNGDQIRPGFLARLFNRRARNNNQADRQQ